MRKLATFGIGVVWIGLAVTALAQIPVGEPGFVLSDPPTSRLDTTVGSSSPPDTYGTTDLIQVNYPSIGFTPLGDGEWSHLSATGWSFRSLAGNTTMCTAIHFPSGASVTGITTYTNDTDAGSFNDITYSVLQYDFASSVRSTIFAFTTSGSPGIERVFRPFSPGPLVVDNDRKGYSVCIAHAMTGTTLESAGATFSYRLQVSPGPAVATFADVPVGTPQFRFVEALVAAGITAGCGGGNYCPAQPVTRGQMAVFLATALGLHFPN